VLNIVVTGEWQSGAWTITRASGAPIEIRKIFRDSVPAGAPQYEIGWAHHYRDDVLTVDHRLYFMLAEAVGSPEILRVRGPSGLEMLIPVSDRYLETPVIHVNQVGYSPTATRRYAYVSGWLGDGGALPIGNFPEKAEVIEESSGKAIATLPIAMRSALDAEAGGEVREIDLAGVAGADDRRLRVRIPGVGVSWPTAVSEAEVSHAFWVITRGLYLNRWGGDLKKKLTEWTRPPDRHPVFTGELDDFTKLFPEATPKLGKRELTAGYHDAGNFEQRPMSVVVPQLLMRAWELNSAHLAARQLKLPESGNGIPDFLDEVLWGVAFWEQMQEQDGGVREGVQSYRHPWGFYLASQDILPYWTFARDANITARAAGVFAQAARLIASYNRHRAAELQQRAIKAWAYAAAHGASEASRLYAAGELFRLTKMAIYKAEFERAWKEMGPAGAFSSFATDQLRQGDYKTGKRAMPDFLQAYLADPGADAAIKSAALARLTRFADEAAARVDSEHAYRNPRPAKYPMDWGQGTSTVRFLDTVIARMQLGGLSAQQKQRYFDTLSLAADYLLGGNPNGLVYVTGLGARRVEEPLHLDSLVFLKQGKEAVPGIPVFGPTAAAPRAAYTLPTVGAFYPAFDQRPEGLRYADVRTVPNWNEFSVWETQAPDVELFAILVN
jgi:endoglucanase